MSDPKIVIVCCPRTLPNVHSTLAGLLLADPRSAACPIAICADSAPDQLMHDLYGHLGLELIFLSPEEQHAQAHRSAVHRARYAHGRAIRSGVGHPGGVLVLEDDVAFARGYLDAAAGDKLVWGYGRPPVGALWVYYPPRLAAVAAAGALGFDSGADINSKAGAAIDIWLGMWIRDSGEVVRVVPVAQHLGDASVVGNGWQGARRSSAWRPTYDPSAAPVYSCGTPPVVSHMTQDRARRYRRRGLL